MISVRSKVQIFPGPPFAWWLGSSHKINAWMSSRNGRDGAIAQLGERLLCKQEVVGSIPSGSTRPCGSPNAEYEFPPLSRAGGFLDIVKKGYARDAGQLSTSSWGIGIAQRCACTASRDADRPWIRARRLVLGLSRCKLVFLWRCSPAE